jgi:GTP 3',8-cyclase
MPLDADANWGHDKVVPGREIVEAIDAVYPMVVEPRGHDPAERHAYRDGLGRVGVIPTVTEAFCGSCDRVRLTAEGGFRNCLFALEETDLRALMRSGAGDDELAAGVQASVSAKWAGHQIQQVNFIRPARSMSQIGG